MKNNFLSSGSDYYNNGVSSENITCCLSDFSSTKIDEVSVLSILMKNYIIGDRTLIKGLSKTQWMSDIDNNGEINLYEVASHGDSFDSYSSIALKLKHKLKNEILSSIITSGADTVGILLTGGMDSRIVSSILKELQSEGQFRGEVVALTWGLSESRDVIYSQQIAKLFDWEFVHFPVSAETVFENIEISAKMGAEFSPIHLHAMQSVSNIKGIDLILAGSYGDSIGRGEYSGRKVGALPDILESNLNKFGLLQSKIENGARDELQKDLTRYRERFSLRNEQQLREVEMQCHYMRRQLNSCMSLIDKKIPLVQVFTSDDVYSYIWSLSYTVRNDEIYHELLKLSDKRLLDIPWARTGKLYNSNSRVFDSYTSINNMYGKWLRQDNRDYIIKLILDGSLQSINIFDNDMLKFWCDFWSRSNTPKADRLDEKMAWLASLSQFVNCYNISASDCNGYDKRNIISKARMLSEYKLYRAAMRFK